MPKLVTVEQMHAIEAAADAAGVSYAAMMETAGVAVAARVTALIGDLQITDPRVAVLVGKGNNGGDGLVAARELLTGARRWSTSFWLNPATPMIRWSRPCRTLERLLWKPPPMPSRAIAC